MNEKTRSFLYLLMHFRTSHEEKRANKLKYIVTQKSIETC